MGKVIWASHGVGSTGGASFWGAAKVISTYDVLGHAILTVLA